MKHKLVLLTVVFFIVLTAALPVALPTGENVARGSEDVVTAQVMDLAVTINYDPECPPPGSGAGGC